MSNSPHRPKRLRWLTIAPLVLGAGGLALLLAMVSPSGLVRAFAAFDPRLLPLLAAIVVADYAVRFWRWRWLVKLTTGTKPPLAADLACFLAANTLILTPLRAGDLSRSAYAQALFDTPATQTGPVPLLERIVDLVLMTLFAMLGILAFGASPLLALGGCLIAGIIIALLRFRRMQSLAVVLIARTAGAGVADHVAAFFGHLDGIWRLKPISVAFVLGAMAWLLECAAFFVVLWGLGVEPSFTLVGQSAFIYPVANLAGSLSLLPGGLGVAEGSVARLTQSLVGVDASTALAAALLIRGAIVGFGVISGLPGLMFVSSRMVARRQERAALIELQVLIVHGNAIEA